LALLFRTPFKNKFVPAFDLQSDDIDFRPGASHMNEELTAFIIRELGKYRDRKNIIQKICERGELNCTSPTA
jgi:hypothetical protein